jgi:hypothetical protein
MNYASYRYCNPRFNQDPPVNCKDPIAISDAYAPLQPGSWTFEKDDSYWHQVDVEGLGGIGENDFDPLACDYSCSGNACSDPSYYRTWSYEQDFARWIPKFPGLTKRQTGKYDETKAGRFWYHVDTPVGTSPEVAKVWGFPVHMKNDGKTPADSLANHYEPLEPHYVVGGVYGKDVPSPIWPWHFSGALRLLDVRSGR